MRHRAYRRIAYSRNRRANRYDSLCVSGPVRQEKCTVGNVHRVFGLWLVLPFACWAQTKQTSPVILRKRRFQRGSLQQVRRGKAKRWVVLYYNGEGKRQYHTLLGTGSMTKTQAEKERDEFMRSINGCDEPGNRGIRPVLLGEFIEQKYLPFQRKKWKASTAGTSENRIQHHIVKGIGGDGMRDFSLTSLQAFLDRKADEGLSFSVVDHLRWDLSAIFEMAIANKVVDVNPATRLYTPKKAPKGKSAPCQSNR
jgi:hypothetical protein